MAQYCVIGKGHCNGCKSCENFNDNYNCPECGKECEKIYYNDSGALGCDLCVKSKDSWEYNAESECE